MNEPNAVTDAAELDVDLRDRLRLAAGSLAADFSGHLSAAHAEALVYTSAKGLLAEASVMEFVPILAERRARLAVRSGLARGFSRPADGSAVAAGAAPDTVTSVRTVAAPLLTLPEEQLTRLRREAERAGRRLADWRAGLERA